MILTFNQQIIELLIMIPKKVIRQWQLMEWNKGIEISKLPCFWAI